MHKELNVRGLACPGPVLQVKETLEDQAVTAVTVLVDNDAARENVSRFLQSRGFAVTFSANGEDFVVTATKGEGGEVASAPLPAEKTADADKKIMVLISAATMGAGDDELGGKLMVNYLKTLKEMGSDLWRLVFINGGVKMTVTGSLVIETLRDYERNGLLILVCGTCLEHFNLMGDKQVGQTTNMLDIVTAMQLADTVITVG